MRAMYDLIIVGGGPAGAAAAVYAARKRLNTLFITAEWGGQSTISTDIQNWIGTPSISGADLGKALRAHVEAYAGQWLTIMSPMLATGLTPHDDHVTVTTKDGAQHEGKALVVTTGAKRRTLDIPGAAEYDQKGLTYCASCDGPLFAEQDVVVIGGGNAGFESALQLLAYCKSVTLLNRSSTFRADQISVDAALAHPNMRVLKNVEPTAVLGDKFVNGLRIKHTDTGTEETLSVAGIFVEIGLVPNTAWLGNTVELNDIQQIKIDPRTGRTSHPRIWAAGDITDGLYHQNNIAAGDAVKALEDVYRYLRTSAKRSSA